ncbi:MAG: SMP-30/gluconolactonase/LRE family protein [Rhodospirillaceae bacterium]|nr:SMP-30/gluconolactonase/LRE family protein [Rhodospirillaceae bacterium]
MKTALKAIGFVVAVVLIVVGALVTTFVVRSGMLVDRGPEHVTACTIIDGQNKSGEDILIDRERNLALVSWMDRRGQVEGNPTPGLIGKIDLSAAEPKIEVATLADPPDLRTHGMTLYIGPDGQRVLFAISHPIGKPHRVEIFEANAEGVYEHKQTVEGDGLFKPNDIAAVGPRQFYVANDSGAKTGLEKFRESMLGAAIAQITYFDGEKFSVAYDGVAAPGGINVSPDMGTVYVAETQGHKVTAFRRDVVTGKLTHLYDIPLNSLPDNIDVAADGSLWVASHANAIALVRQFADKTKVAPTQIFRITTEGKPEAKQVFFTKGDVISAGSVAAVSNGKMLVGSITDKKILLCDEPK